MTYDEAVSLLPPTYAHALRLHGQGCDEEQIARELAVEAAAVGPLLRLAQAKLTRLLGTGQDAAAAPTEGESTPAPSNEQG
jgi:hypothetical protein